MAAILVAWVFIRSLKRSEDPAALVLKWILSGVTICVLLLKVAPMIWTSGEAGAYLGIPLVACCGMVLAIIWRRSISSIVANQVGSLFDGGDREVEPRPAYSMAQAKRNRGRYAEAVAEVRKQLAQFPTDLEGQLLLAQLQAEHMNDLQGAEVTIQRLCHQPGQTPGHLALALNTLADWHLKLAQDRDAARQDLETIIALLPDTEFSTMAAQRIAHLAGTAYLLEPHDRRALHVGPGIQDMGLLSGDKHPVAPETQPAAAAEAYVKHLEEHPLDTEAREKLAVIYAEHYRRLDLAADQLEQLIGHPTPARQARRALVESSHRFTDQIWRGLRTGPANGAADYRPVPGDRGGASGEQPDRVPEAGTQGQGTEPNRQARLLRTGHRPEARVTAPAVARSACRFRPRAEYPSRRLKSGPAHPPR